jgi:hypothetical protein
MDPGKVAATDLKFKRDLESVLRFHLVRYFNRIVKGVRLTGEQFDITQHNVEFVAANSATYPTVNAKDYGLNPHPDQLFDGCECCNSHD